MTARVFACFITSFAVATAQSQVGWPLAKVAVHVVDEQGDPVARANVEIHFRQKLSDENQWIVGETGGNGVFSAEGYSDKRLGGYITKAGYYGSGTGWIVFGEPLFDKWQPWNPVVEVTLRPIGKPVALNAKQVQGDIPVLDRACGYDFERGDWVAPYGKGVIADLTFVVRRDYKDRKNFTAEALVTFAQPLGGLVRMNSPAYAHHSEFRWERFAPEGGYSSAPFRIAFSSHEASNHVDRKASFQFRASDQADQGYFLRVRVVEQDGHIMSANYGKIAGDIVIDPRDTKTCYIAFTYYFNPAALDRNLEWDRTKNLIPNLKPEEAPRDP